MFIQIILPCLLHAHTHSCISTPAHNNLYVMRMRPPTYTSHYSTISVIRHILDQGTTGLPKKTDYWKKSEHILSCTAEHRGFRIDYHLTEFIIIYLFYIHVYCEFLSINLFNMYRSKTGSFMEAGEGPNWGCGAKGKKINI
jgi:hypothetical protein